MSKIEEQRQQIKDLNDLANQYRALSEIYICELQDYERPSRLISVAMGVLVEMISDLNVYHKKHKQTAKSKQQQHRISLLTKVINEFSVIADRNAQIKQVLTKYVENERIKDERIKELENEIEKIKLNIAIYNME